MPILTVENLGKQFGGLHACKDVSFELNEGEILGVMGPNGAGKSTLFDCISSYYRPDSGEIRYRGRNIGVLGPARVNRLGIARTFQKLRPFTGMTLAENVMVGALARTRRVHDARATALQLLDYVGLGAKSDTFAEHLSTGQRKRLEVARALATRPDLLLLDEVTGGVDVTAIPGLLQLVRQLRDDGTTIVIIEHNARALTSLSDRLLAMHLGQVITVGTPQDVTAHPDVISAYLGGSFA